MDCEGDAVEGFSWFEYSLESEFAAVGCWTGEDWELVAILAETVGTDDYFVDCGVAFVDLSGCGGDDDACVAADWLGETVCCVEGAAYD